jgi:hypothetical protein
LFHALVHPLDRAIERLYHGVNVLHRWRVVFVAIESVLLYCFCPATLIDDCVERRTDRAVLFVCESVDIDDLEATWTFTISAIAADEANAPSSVAVLTAVPPSAAPAPVRIHMPPATPRPPDASEPDPSAARPLKMAAAPERPAAANAGAIIGAAAPHRIDGNSCPGQPQTSVSPH